MKIDSGKTRFCGWLVLSLLVFITIHTAHSKELALVVGINDYIHMEPFDPVKKQSFYDLRGSKNDAIEIAASLRARKIDLPDDRLLLDHDATLSNFLDAWHSMIKDAESGDTLIVTFSGHGWQEKEVNAPLDEKDNKDETLIFSDFEPSNPHKGRITDDQLHELLKNAAQFRIVLVMDSCHSGGLDRLPSPGMAGLLRNGGGGSLPIPMDPPPEENLATEGEENSESLPHVTQILGSATDTRAVREKVMNNKWHGALSWFFAKALEGEADTDGNKVLTDLELSVFLKDRVFTAMEQNQLPRFLPLPNGKPLIGSIGAGTFNQDKKKKSDLINLLPVRVVGKAPADLADGQCKECVLVDQTAMLTFKETNHGWQVFNAIGDEVGRMNGDAAPYIKRARFLAALNAEKNNRVAPAPIKPKQSSKKHAIGKPVGFTFFPPDKIHQFATIFNLASTGKVQYPIHPINFDESLPVKKPFDMTFRVGPPTGEDQLIAIWCKRPAIALNKALLEMSGTTVEPMSKFLELTSDNSCQFARFGLYTKEK